MSDWIFTRLGDLLRSSNEKSSRSDQFPVLTSSRSGLHLQSEYFNRVVASKDNTGYKIIRKGQFTYRAMSDDGFFRFNRLSEQEAGIISPAYEVFECDTNKADPIFIDYLLNSGIVLSQIYGTAQGGTRLSLRLSTLSEFEVEIPPLPEQKKIAEILSGIDNLIKTIDIKIAKLNIANTEVSRDIFSDFSPTEEEAVLPQDQSKSIKTLPLESVCEAVVDCKNRTPPYVDRGYPVIRTPNVRNGRLVIADLRYTDEESYQIWTARSVPRPMDILFTREAPLGEACLIPNGFRCCLGQRMMLFRANKSLLDPQYLLYAMMSPFVQEQLGKSKGGTTVGHARVTDIRKIKIPILPMEKQLQVGYLLASIKSCLQQTIEKKEKMRTKKNALASDLLSGRKRVTI